MLKHFNNLRTSLNVVHEYPTTTAQEQRFLKLGWDSARGRTLWDLWGDDGFLNSWQRAALNTVEPFDEWEEFALFASHYFLLVAMKSPSAEPQSEGLEWYLKVGQDFSYKGLRINTNVEEPYEPHSCIESSLSHSDQICVTRRFGALLRRTDEILEMHGGFGLQARAIVSQLFASDHVSQLPFPENPMKSRVCHAITRLDRFPYLNIMTGGRASPDEAFADCWRQADNGIWYEEAPLPKPLYRHSAVSIHLGNASNHDGAVLVYGGRSTGGKVMNDWYLCQFPVNPDGSRGAACWSHLLCEGSTLQPRFGASLITTGASKGVVLGGMGKDGRVLSEMYQWNLEQSGEALVVHVSNQSHNLTDLGSMACRIGATVTSFDKGWTMVGGIIGQSILPKELEILNVVPQELQKTGRSAGFELQVQPMSLTTPSLMKCPLFIGHQAVETENGVAIAGGGANCFSFGTYWNTGLFFLSHDPQEAHRWQEVERAPSKNESKSEQLLPQLNTPSEDIMAAPFRSIKVSSQFDFQDVVRSAKPVVIEGLTLGPCYSKWTLSYIREAMTSDRQVRCFIRV